MDDATRLMRVLAVLAMAAPLLLSRLPMLRRHARPVGLTLALLYLGFGIGFVVWYTLIRPAPG